MDNCIFCKIISGEIPSSKVYEDDKVLAFLDISQATKGHTLVIPKEHVRNILEMSAETAETVFSRVPKIARAVQKATRAIGMNILNNNEEVAGQTALPYRPASTSFLVTVQTTVSTSALTNTNQTSLPWLTLLTASLKR